jgi:hypothetical protein
MTSRDRTVNWLLTYGGWAVMAVLVALWTLPVPRGVRLAVSIAALVLSICMHVALQRRRRSGAGGER